MQRQFISIWSFATVIALAVVLTGCGKDVEVYKLESMYGQPAETLGGYVSSEDESADSVVCELHPDGTGTWTESPYFYSYKITDGSPAEFTYEVEGTNITLNFADRNRSLQGSIQNGKMVLEWDVIDTIVLVKSQ